ncbi:hypothetical protein A1O3_04441 [Capronia epimyces CBS 606.96]|uniref:Major facilitator superfamily (MFS) profile domain-containing protein n=1 Tax=Capronia epimyces CBS 606.96 TaxID=1182542 RepID=W9YDZ6_9EURO|nr:uncharacterized protein A1O3_04441 [Capronia epimyces CBS 606.96]EXJ87481.1 hypothetical protein A1O3_04441 [Capronia epimyces CBS 606.96]
MADLTRVTTADTLTADAIGGEHLGNKYYRSFRFIGTILGTSLALCAAYAAYLLPVGIISYINEDIGPDPDNVWIPVVWAICVALGYMLFGRLSDIFGRRYFVVIGNLFGLIGAIVAATASNIRTLIGASVFIGIAASVQLSYTMIVGELVPIKHRGYWYFLTLIPVIPFAFFGAYLSHNFLQVATWRWCYYLCIILQGLALVLLVVSYHPPSFRKLHSTKSRTAMIKEIDYIGVFIWMVGVVLFLLGINWGGSKYPWDSAAVISTLVLGIVGIVSFFVWEANGTAKKPLLPWAFLIKNPRGFLLPMVSGTIGGMFYYGLTIIWPTQVNTVYASSLQVDGWLASILACGTQTGTMLGSLVFKRLGHHRLQLIGAYVFMIAFCAGLSQAGVHQRSVAVSCAFLTGLGCGVVENLVVLVAQVGKDAAEIGLVVGTIGSFRSLGGALAQAIYVTILTNKLKGELASKVPAAALKAGLPASSLPALFQAIAAESAAAFAAVPGISTTIVAAVELAEVEAYSASFQYVYYACIAFGGVGLITSLFITKNVDAEMTDFVAKKLEGVAVKHHDHEHDLEGKPGTGTAAHEETVMVQSIVEEPKGRIAQ